PWLYSELTQKQYKSLFYLNLEIKNEMNQELHKYLQIIIDEFIEEKNQTNSLINKLMNDNEQTGSIKKCLVCYTSNINNKKQLYPNCNAKLPTINKLKLLNELLEIANNTKKSFIFTLYISNKLDKQIALKNKINIPQIFIPDPKNINPNSVANLKKILDHIEEISGIKENKCKWIVIIFESCRFRVKIRKTKFLNPNNDNFQSINSEWKLSEEMKKFSELAQAKRIEFIQKVLINKNLTKTWHPISITTEEADFQKSEKSLTRQEILTIIKSLISYLNDVDCL
ncbi:39778_t:CDS:2, partial [Gigaspora margarita]